MEKKRGHNTEEKRTVKQRRINIYEKKNRKAKRY